AGRARSGSRGLGRGFARAGPRAEIALERREPRLEGFELLARALEHGALHVEFLARDEIHALETGMQQRTEIALEIAAERAEILRKRLGQLPGQIVQIETVRVVGHRKSFGRRGRAADRDGYAKRERHDTPRAAAVRAPPRRA